jgi:hypothetical protein
VSFIDEDVMFFVFNIRISHWYAPDTAAAVKQTAAPPYPTFPAAVDGFRAAGNAKGTVEKVS